jgi:zinc/manganese transport system permease protein
VFAYFVGAAGYASGLIVSSISDLPSGAIIVWALVVSGLVFKLFLHVRLFFPEASHK